MYTKSKWFRFTIMLCAALLLALAAAPARVESTQASSGTTVTKIRVDGLSAQAFLFDPAANVGGFVFVVQDEIANTASLDFSYGTAHPTDPDMVVIYQGSGEIANTALTITSSLAHLALTTPDSYPVYRCDLNIITGDYTCVPNEPLTFDLTWVENGLGSVHEKTKRTETFGPVTIKFDADFISHTALVSGTWTSASGELSGTDMTGTLYDTQNKSFIREITMKLSP